MAGAALVADAAGAATAALAVLGAGACAAGVVSRTPGLHLEQGHYQ